VSDSTSNKRIISTLVAQKMPKQNLKKPIEVDASLKAVVMNIL